MTQKYSKLLHKFCNKKQNIQNLGILRICTWIMYIAHLIWLESVLYRIINHQPFSLWFPSPTFRSVEAFRFDWLYIPYPWLERLPVPSFEQYYLLELIILLLTILWTIGLQSRLTWWLAFLLSIYLFSLSQLSYHHHIFLLLLTIGMLVVLWSWKTLTYDAMTKEHNNKKEVTRYTYLPFQILISTIYFFSGLSKINQDRLSGDIMRLFLWESHRLYTLLNNIGIYSFQPISLLIIFSLFFLSVWFRFKSTRYVALIIGILFHLAIDATFDVGTYSYQMICLYLVFFTENEKTTPNQAISQ